MRHWAVRLVTILIYCYSSLLLPATVLQSQAKAMPDTHAEVKTCSCQMCHTSKGIVKHCSCCRGGICSCEISSNDLQYLVMPAPKPGLLSTFQEFVLALEGSPLYIKHSSFPSAPFLAVPSPPPKPHPA